MYYDRNGFSQGAFVSLDHFVAVFSAAVTFAGLLLVAIQMRDATRERKNATRQREAESLAKIYDVNRELFTLGFSHPQLFSILRDGENADPVLEQYYLQLWLNQLSQIHLYLRRSVFDAELKESLERETADFVTHRNVRRFWEENGAFYPASFQRLVKGIIEKGEPPQAAARQASDAQHLAGDLLKGRAGHPHEGFAAWRGQNGVFGGSRNVALDEHVAVVGEDGRRAGASMA